MSTLDALLESLSTPVTDHHAILTLANNEITVEVDKAHLRPFCIALRDTPEFGGGFNGGIAVESRNSLAKSFGTLVVLYDVNLASSSFIKSSEDTLLVNWH